MGDSQVQSEDQSSQPLLSVEGLSVSFEVRGRYVQAVHDVNFQLYPGENLGIIGESGCGKSVTALALMRLIPKPAGRIDRGNVSLGNLCLSDLSKEEFRLVRGRRLAMIFQEPMTALNPVLRIGEQLEEACRHSNRSKKNVLPFIRNLLIEVGLVDAERILFSYPHQLSGGMKQRVMIGMALAGEPEVLIADEPTTALDVTIQAQILRLLEKLKRKHGFSSIIITHDLGVVAQTCNRVLVMYGGRIVESGLFWDLLQNPAHPYTQGLFQSMPGKTKRKLPLPTIPGSVPPLGGFPQGCSFANRCYRRSELCEKQIPASEIVQGEHRVSCFHPVNIKATF